jgi:tetratricopeptide (TPR) repeat protein
VGKIIRSRQDHGCGLRYIAVAQYNLGRLEEALSNIQTALGLQPNRVEYSFNLGWMLMRKGDVKGAEKAFGEVLKTGKGGPEALMVEAFQAIEEKDFMLAVRKAGEAGRQDPSNQRADWLQGLCFEKEEKWDEALKCYQEALSKDNHDIDVQEAWERAAAEVRKKKNGQTSAGKVSPDNISGERRPDEEKTP